MDISVNIQDKVLNLVISGIPSIPTLAKIHMAKYGGFKPCYKWNTFNTSELELD